MSNNLLTAVINQDKKEDRVTEAFVHLLRHLKAQKPDTAISLFSLLSNQTFNISAEDLNRLELDTRQPLPNRKRPDIWIKGTNFLVLVEVKVDLHPGKAQLEDYINGIKRVRQVELSRRHVVLLTRHPLLQELRQSQWILPTVYWFQVATFLEDYLKGRDNSGNDSVTEYLIKQLLEFLVDEGIEPMRQVEESLLLGLKPLGHLLQILRITLENKRWKSPKDAIGPEALGYDFNLKNRKCFMGIYTQEPKYLAFAVEKGNARKDNLFPVSDHLQKLEDEKWLVGGKNLVEEGFFLKTMNGQRQYVERFIDEYSKKI